MGGGRSRGLLGMDWGVGAKSGWRVGVVGSGRAPLARRGETELSVARGQLSVVDGYRGSFG